MINSNLNTNISRRSGSPFPTSDLLLKYSTLSGNDIIEEKQGLNAKLLYPQLTFFRVAQNNGISFTYADNGLFDIAQTGEISLFAHFKTSSDITNIQYITGKSIYTGTNNIYGIYISASKLYALAYDNVSSKIVVSSADITINTEYKVIATFKDSDKIHFYIETVEQGNGTSIGTFTHLSNEFEFKVGAINSTDGTSYARVFSGNIFNVKIFNRVVTTQEITDLNNLNTISSGCLAHYPIVSNNFLTSQFDTSGNNRHLVSDGATILSTRWTYGDNSNNHMVKKGYSVYTKLDSDNLYVPYMDAGLPLDVTIGTEVPAGYFHHVNVPAISDKYNFAPTKIDFDYGNTDNASLAIFKRSDVTIHTDVSRSASDYDVSNPCRYLFSNFNISILKTFFESDHLWKLFPKASINSVNLVDRVQLDNVFVYSTKRTESQKLSMLRYTGDYNKFYSIDYYWEDRHIAAHRDNKVLFCDDAGGLTLSLDGGTTVGDTLDVSTDLSFVSFAHIWANGNITFCSLTKAYVSTDNLATYQEATVLDADGNPYTASGNGVFRSIGTMSHVKNGKELLGWGCYATDAAADVAYNDINIWTSVDNGLTIKSKYKFKYSEPFAYARHVHGVFFNSNDDTVWIQTGDAATEGNECHWMKGVYDWDNDLLPLEIVQSDNGAETGTYIKAQGFVFYDDYLYWGTDKTGVSTIGLWRVPYNDVTNTAKYEQLTDSYQCVCLAGTEDGEMIQGIGTTSKYIYTTLNGFNFLLTSLSGGPTLDSTFPIFVNNKGKNAAGYYCIDIMEDGETYPDFTRGTVLMVKFNKNN